MISFVKHEPTKWLANSAHDLKGCRFKSRLILYTIWEWGKSLARIDFSTQFWFNLKIKKKIQVAKWGPPTKNMNRQYKNCTLPKEMIEIIQLISFAVAICLFILKPDLCFSFAFHTKQTHHPTLS